MMLAIFYKVTLTRDERDELEALIKSGKRAASAVRNASERSSIKMLVQLEQFREFFLRTMSKGRVYDPRPLIFVFDTDKQYNPFQRRGPDGKEEPSDGLFLGGSKPRILMKNDYIEQGLRTIFHEYTHSLVKTRFGDDMPL
jgi:hypothetical protein